VRAQAAHLPACASISIDSEINITAGFAHEWLRWMHEQKSAREDGFKSRQLFLAKSQSSSLPP
jgi:hypothetical protein